MRGSCALAALALGGCTSLVTLRSAEPVPAGRWRADVSFDVGSYRDREQGSAIPAAHVEVAARRGLGHDTDVTLKLLVPGLELGAQRRLTEGPWQVAAAVALGAMRTRQGGGSTDAIYGHLRATALVTRRTSSCWAWTFGPVATAGLFLPAGGGSASGVLVGAFGNVERALGSAWVLVPELSLHVAAAGDVPVRGTVAQLAVALGRRW